jgi:hypothetical protein
MTSKPEFQKRTGEPLSPLDLKQIQDAVSELRASCPNSVLVDLVEEKIRVVEEISLIRRASLPSVQGQRAAD